MNDSHLLGLNVLLVEDHPALRKGLELILRGVGCHVIGTAATVAAGARLYGLRRPDVVIADYVLGEGRGTDLIQQIHSQDPAAKIIVYTGSTDAEAHAGILSSGAHGLVLKGSDINKLFDALVAVAAGRRFVDPASGVRRDGCRPRRLTRRQGEILSLLADGLTGEQAARQLVLSPETVRTHVRNAMSRLGAETRVHAVTIAARSSEISL